MQWIFIYGFFSFPPHVAACGIPTLKGHQLFPLLAYRERCTPVPAIWGRAVRFLRKIPTAASLCHAPHQARFLFPAICGTIPSFLAYLYIPVPL